MVFSIQICFSFLKKYLFIYLFRDRESTSRDRDRGGVRKNLRCCAERGAEQGPRSHSLEIMT